MATTTNQIKKRQDGILVAVPVAAAKKLLQGTLAFADASGFATDVKVDANTEFLGIVSELADNTTGAAGDVSVEVETDGVFELPGASLTQADVGVAIHATDNWTTSKTATANPKIGVLAEFVSATIGRVAVAGVGRSAG